MRVTRRPVACEAEDDADDEDRHEAHQWSTVEEATHALLEDQDRRAEGGEHRQHEADGCREGHEDRAEDEHEEDERQPDDDGEVGQERALELLGDVGLDRGEAGDADADSRARLDVGTGGPQLVERVTVSLVVRPLRG